MVDNPNLPRREYIDSPQSALELCQQIGTIAGFPEYVRIFYGLPLDQAVAAGYMITQRGIYEAAETPSARDTATTIADLAGTEGLVLDLFAGSGQVTTELVQAGFVVLASEQDAATFVASGHNLELDGTLASVRLYNVNYAELITGIHGSEVAAVYIDPPWNGNYKYDLSLPFTLNDMDPHGAELVDLLVESLGCGVIALKVPMNIAVEELQTLAAKLDCRLLLVRQLINEFPVSLNQSTAYFYEMGKGYQFTEENRHLVQML